MEWWNKCTNILTHTINITIYCTCRCILSFRRNERPHVVKCTLRNGQNVHGTCTCNAGEGGHCNHVLAKLYSFCTFANNKFNRARWHYMYCFDSKVPQIMREEHQPWTFWYMHPKSDAGEFPSLGKWPSISLHLNRIKNLWVILKDGVYEPPYSTNMAQFKENGH